MLQARYKNKSQSEDLKTSSILGSLLLLPDDLLWELLVKSCCGGTEKLPDVAGVLDSFEFWPRWNADNTTNLKYVEPDLFLRFSNFDVIVEVKQFDGNGQYYEQWENVRILMNMAALRMYILLPWEEMAIKSHL